LPVSESKARDLLAWRAIRDVDVGIVTRIAVCGESGSAISEVAFEIGLRAECQPAHGRVKSVGPHYEVEPPGRRAVELYCNALLILV
jgi:hypothetical protein